jgi:hypothetical protein
MLLESKKNIDWAVSSPFSINGNDAPKWFAKGLGEDDSTLDIRYNPAAEDIKAAGIVIGR